MGLKGERDLSLARPHSVSSPIPATPCGTGGGIALDLLVGAVGAAVGAFNREPESPSSSEPSQHEPEVVAAPPEEQVRFVEVTATFQTLERPWVADSAI